MVKILAAGWSQAQVTSKCKELLAAHLQQHGLRSASAESAESSVLFSAYDGGDWVAISLKEDAGSTATSNYNSARYDIVGAYHRNKKIHADCFQVHRQYIERVADRHSSD